MFYVLLLLGFIAMGAGVFTAGYGVPIRETSFGAALLIAGSVAITGGFIMVGLAAAVRELQRVVKGLKARLPGGPRQVRPMEQRDGERPDRERIAGSDRRPEPRLPTPAALGSEILDVIPSKLEASDTQRMRSKPGPGWFGRAVAEIEPASRQDETAPASDNYRNEETRRPPDEWTRAAAEPPESILTEARQAPAVSPHNTFDTLRPSEQRNPEGAPEQRTEQSADPQEASELQMRPTEVKSPPVAPARPSAPPIAPTRGVRVEPRQLPIAKSGVIDEMAYTLFTDGSIEAQTPRGTMRFASIEALRKHLEKSED